MIGRILLLSLADSQPINRIYTLELIVHTTCHFATRSHGWLGSINSCRSSRCFLSNYWVTWLRILCRRLPSVLYFATSNVAALISSLLVYIIRRLTSKSCALCVPIVMPIHRHWILIIARMIC